MCFMSTVKTLERGWAGVFFFVIVCHHFNIWRHFSRVIYLLWVGDVFHAGKCRTCLVLTVWHETAVTSLKGRGRKPYLCFTEGGVREPTCRIYACSALLLRKVKNMFAFEWIPGNNIQWHRETFTTKSQRFIYFIFLVLNERWNKRH